MVTVSESLRHRLIEIGIDGSHITTLRNGVDLELFRPTDQLSSRRKLGIPLDHDVVLSVGNLLQLKGHHVLIRALNGLKEKTLLIIVGEGPYRRTLEKIAISENVVERVRFCGAVAQDQLPCYYSASDVLAHASSSEGMANVWLEALACGRPVVTSDVGGAKEVLRDPVAGALVSSRAPEEFSQAIQGVLLTARSPADVRRYATTFSWQETIDRQTSVYQSAIDAHKDRVGS